MSGTLIVGAGQAGAQLAVSLRDLGYTEPITLMGSETQLPYQRPPLSKAYLLGELAEAKLHLRKAHFYAGKDIEVVTGTSVTDVGFDDDSGWATTSAGNDVGFSHLALTTGSTPRELPAAIGAASNVFYLRTIGDADRLQSALPTGTRFVVIGGGFIGLEAAAVLTAHGKQVTVIEFADRLLKRVASAQLGEFYRAAHERRGVGFHLGRAAVSLDIDAAGRAVGVVLDDGTTIECDAVVAGLGVVRDRFLPDRLNLTWDNGIVVDHAARTSNRRVVAAGDCAVGPHPMAEGLVRIESVQNAVDQAKVAAATICGHNNSYDTVPWFWSNQGSLRLQTAGLFAESDDQVLRGDPDDENFAVVYLRNGQLRAVESMNRPADFATARKLIAAGATLTADVSTLADPDAPLVTCFHSPTSPKSE